MPRREEVLTAVRRIRESFLCGTAKRRARARCTPGADYRDRDRDTEGRWNIPVSIRARVRSGGGVRGGQRTYGPTGRSRSPEGRDRDERETERERERESGTERGSQISITD